MKFLAKPAAIALVSLALVACGQTSSDSTPSAEDRPQAETAIGRTVAKAINEARDELATQNLSLNNGFDVRIGNARIGKRESNDLPRAEITPQGELLIEGKPVAMDADQQRLALAYRQDIIAIANVGMDMGIQGADFGMRAARDAIVGIFKGNMEEVEKKIEAEAKQFEVAAVRLCALMPALLTSQDALAASLAEFKPYARMTQKDVDDCGDEKWSSEIGDIAGNTDQDDGTATDAAAEADAAAGADTLR